MVGVACRTTGAPPAGQNATAPGEGDPTRGMAPPQALAALAVQYWDTHLRDQPLQATELGDRRFDDRLPDSTPAGRARQLAALAALRDRVAAVPASALTPGDRVTRSLLLGEIDSA